MSLYKKFKHWFEMFPPEYLDNKGWKDFDSQCKENYPYRYWLNETVIPNVWWPVTRTYKSIVSYIRFGYFEKMHLIDTGLKPGYYDKDTLLLHSMFSILKDFVEIEKAWMEAIFNKDYKRPWWKLNSRFRNREYGIEYLDWEIALVNETDEANNPQAEIAKIIKELYLWWVDIRPVRMDPYDLIQDNYDGKLFKDWFYDLDKPLSENKKIIYKKIDKLEKDYYDEDTEMMKKLIKIRSSLWT